MKAVTSSLKAIIFFLVYNIGVINLSLSLKDRFLKPNIKEIRRNLYGIENKRNFPIKKIKEIEENLLELEESLPKLKKYYDFYDIEYKVLRDEGNLFKLVN